MNSELYHAYLIEQVLDRFYAKRLSKLQELTLASVLKRKNPYLFKAKNIELAGDFVKSIVDAYLSSQEETMFGDLMEAFAIYISEKVDGGIKPKKRKSVDLEFWRNNAYHIVGIKSGTSWGNSDQINKMKENFKKAREELRASGIQADIIAVNGCMYGTDDSPFKPDSSDPDKSYYKYAGQDFWYFISGDDNLYREIIIPIDKEAKKKDEAFKAAYVIKQNEMLQDFVSGFVVNNEIDWIKIIDFVSKRRSQRG